MSSVHVFLDYSVYTPFVIILITLSFTDHQGKPYAKGPRCTQAITTFLKTEIGKQLKGNWPADFFMAEVTIISCSTTAPSHIS